jgi:4-amino-4-deoxy-L-arabinose transferase-like glycosyltransferase
MRLLPDRADRREAGVVAASPAAGPALLAGFILLHVAVWTILPLAFTHSLPRDVVQGIMWSQGWQLGYDQPPFQAWILAAVDWLAGYRRWAIFLASQLLVATAFWAVWRLARLVVSPLGALVSVLLLDGVIFFNYNTRNLYPDLIGLPLWTLATLAFYRALRLARLADWAVLGLSLAAAAYGKYTSAILAVVMIGFMLVEPQARRHWRLPGPYLCAGICLLLIAPHLRWAFENGFPTVAHIQHVSRPTYGAADRFLALLGFVGGQIGSVALVAPMLIAARPWRRDTPVRLAGGATPFDRHFVAALALGPILLMTALAAASGVEFRVHWGYAMWCFIGLFAVMFVVPRTDAAGLRRLGWVWAGVFVILAAVYAGTHALTFTARPWILIWGVPRDELMRHYEEEAAYPGRELADAITKRWHERVDSPLAYVVGRKRTAANVSFFSADHPLVVTDATETPWIDVAQLWRRGAVVVWDPERDGDDTTALLQHYPDMEIQSPILLRWNGTATMQPLRIMWAIVYPAGQKKTRPQ